jgi:carbon-monoxide dehydrogenase large subunit
MKHMKFGVGQPMRRVEDHRLIRGAGSFATDYAPDRLVYAHVLRSPHAHAKFRFTDLETARGMKGVLAILTHADVAELGDIPCKGLIQTTSGKPVQTAPYPVLPRDEVRHVGDAVAFVVAVSVERARDAAEAVGIEWTPLPAAIGMEAAMKQGAPLVFADRPGNIAFEAEMGDKAGVDAAFAKADRLISLRIVNNRLVTNYMEPRAAVAEYDRTSKRYTLTLGSQGSHGIRDALCKAIFRIKPERLRVNTPPDVGGGFGTKAFLFREYPLLMVAAEKLKRPVKWVCERTEHFLGDAQGRDNIAVGEMAVDKRGRFLAVKVDLLADMGAYLSQFAPFIPWLGATMTPGLYAISKSYMRFRGVFTHTLPVDAYRGAGRPEAAYLIERLVDHVARELGKTPDAIRALNFVKPDQMPWNNRMGRVYDSGDFEGHMRRAMEVADWANFKSRAKAAAKRGKFAGIGLGSYIEACGGGGPETATVSLEKNGTLTVRVGTQNNGQGHETAYAQLAAQHFDIPLERIRVLQGDTDQVRTGAGTGGSRSIPVGGASVSIASGRLADNLKELAADRLEASVKDLEITDGKVRIAGTDRALDFAAIASLPKATAEKLTQEESWQPPEATYPNGTHLCEVEIDPETGATEITRYIVVDDFGMTLNPLMLAGQVHGGIVQGVGQALLEETVYSGDGQLMTASFMDYAMPRADCMPEIHFETRNIPCKTNVLGVKGAGEAGSIGSCPAVMNAVVDALHRGCGITHIDMPATPRHVRAAIAAARR